MFWDLCCSVGFGRHPMTPLATRWTARASQPQRRGQTTLHLHPQTVRDTLRSIARQTMTGGTRVFGGSGRCERAWQTVSIQYLRFHRRLRPSFFPHLFHNNVSYLPAASCLSHFALSVVLCLCLLDFSAHSNPPFLAPSHRSCPSPLPIRAQIPIHYTLQYFQACVR